MLRAQRQWRAVRKKASAEETMNKHPLSPVTEDDIARFKEDGAICVRQVFDREWCERMRAAVERLLLNPAKRAREATNAGDPGRFHMNEVRRPWHPDPH